MTSWLTVLGNLLDPYSADITVPFIAVCNDNKSFSVKGQIHAKNKCNFRDLLNQCEQELVKLAAPVECKIYKIEKSSFISKDIFISDNTDIFDKILTSWDTNQIISKGLVVKFYIEMEHKVQDLDIQCPEMNTQVSADPLSCSIFKSMKQDYKFSENSLKHLQTYSHYKTARFESPECRYGVKCRSFKRMQEGGYRLDDRCHMEIYRHSPRTMDIKLAKNIFPFKFIQNEEKEGIPVLHETYKPTENDKKRYWSDKNNEGWLKALIEEVITNGQKSDLEMNDGESLMVVVEDKLKHPQHIKLGNPLRKDQMLALILYTGCDSNYKMCAKQRDSDYDTWKWFDLCLYTAIDALWRRETGKYKLYSGLANVKLNSSSINGYFLTYTSTTWNRNVALRFIKQYGDTGMLIEMDDNFRNKSFNRCCNVSWISKFPSECEVLLARGGQFVDKWDVEITHIGDDDEKKRQNSKSFKKIIAPIYQPTAADRQKYWNKNGWLKPLMDELSSILDKDLFHLMDSWIASAKKRLNHPRHQQLGNPLRMDQILALVAFTASEINNTFKRSQRKGNYAKWKWLDLCLYTGILELSRREKTDRVIMNAPGFIVKKGNEQILQDGYLSTYISTSTNQQSVQKLVEVTELATSIILLKSEFQNKSSIICCDISWIIPGFCEHEVLLARSCDVAHGGWKANLIDIFNDDNFQLQDVQLVKLDDLY
eukprot:506479_1